MDALAALQRLREGNQRFVADVRSIAALASQSLRAQHAGGQAPCAIVLGCSDSRSPAEIVFDQGLGDLFVIRVAGNIVAPSQVGSVKFAAQRFGTRLVVVMGHTRCGAIEATIEAIARPEDEKSRNLLSIVDRIRPALEPWMNPALALDHEQLMHQAVRSNVRAATNHLRHGSAILERLIEEEALLVLGAEYDIESGVVDFFDGLPD